FEKLEEYQQQTRDWLFGHLGYDLKNDVENLHSENFDGLCFPELYFFQPQKLVFIKKETVEFHYLRMVDDEMETDLAEILTMEIPVSKPVSNIKTHPRISKKEYLGKVSKMLGHLHRGDIYEANFCQEF